MAKPNEKILVVDDDLDSLDLIGKQVLGASGYQVAMATDGGAAVQQAMTMQPDIVIVSMSSAWFLRQRFFKRTPNHKTLKRPSLSSCRKAANNKPSPRFV